jgi:hypothetical protein
VACTLIAGLSRRVGDLIMGVLRVVVFLALGRRGAVVHPDDIHSQIPVTVEAAMNCFSLSSKVTTYAVCPTCHCTYKPQKVPGTEEVVYPRVCSNTPRPGAAVCGENLLEDGPKHQPQKTFAYHHFDDYLSSMLARPDIERMMDESCDTVTQENPVVVSDVFEAKFLKQFHGPDGQLFVKRHNNEGRYVFALNVDYFNPEGLRVRGAKNSCGIISMTCLNLPLNIRYKPENMYLAGIIPGPSEPHLTELNHYIRPLVDDLKTSWERGFSFSRTALHPTGRIAHTAIAAVVCDLPAARQAAGMAGHGSHFYCTVCSCYHDSTLARTDYLNWKNRDIKQMRKHAEMWRDAKTTAEQVKIFETYGVRWSELWRLPYWDPTCQLVVDSMHCLLEGIVHVHIRHVLGLSMAAQKETVIPAFDPHFTKPATSRPTTPEPPAILRASPALSQQSVTQSSRTFSQQSLAHSQRSTPTEVPSALVKQVALIHKHLVAPVNMMDPATYFEDLKRKLSGQNAQALDFVYQNDILGSLKKPPQRRRQFMDVVELPTLREVNRRLASSRKSTPAIAGPSRKGRMFMDAVELPTIQEVNRRIASSRGSTPAAAAPSRESTPAATAPSRESTPAAAAPSRESTPAAAAPSRKRQGSADELLPSKRVKITVEAGDNGTPAISLIYISF